MKKNEELNIELKIAAISFLNGNGNALLELFTLLKRPVYSYIYRMSHSREISEDILQEVLIIIYEKIETYDEKKSLLAWSIRIARNKYFEYLRHEDKIIRLEKDYSGMMSYKSQRTVYEKIELLNDLEKSLNNLSEEIRETFILKHFQQFKFKEIAEIQDIPVSTVKSRVFYAIKKIREDLKEI